MGISIWQLLIVLLIVLLLFGTKRLRSIGGDLGGAVKGFRSALQSHDSDEEEQARLHGDTSDRVIDGQVSASNAKEQHKEQS